METHEDALSRLLYDSIQDVWVDKLKMEIVPPVDMGGSSCLSIDGVMYPEKYIKNLYYDVRAGINPTKGVSYHKASRSWSLRLSMGGKQKSFGYYRTQEEAIRARKLIIGH